MQTCFNFVNDRFHESFFVALCIYKYKHSKIGCFEQLSHPRMPAILNTSYSVERIFPLNDSVVSDSCELEPAQSRFSDLVRLVGGRNRRLHFERYFPFDNYTISSQRKGRVNQHAFHKAYAP